MGAQATKDDKLTAAEEDIIRETWKKAMKNKTVFAVDIFMNLFEKSPAAHQLFEHLKDIPMDKLRAHKRMKAHSLRVVGALDALVGQMGQEGEDEEEVLIEMFKNVARTHYNRRVVKAHYDLLGEVVIQTFKDEKHLGAEFSEKETTAWLKAYTAMENAILATYKEMESQQG